jgi:hypothetical protein
LIYSRISTLSEEIQNVLQEVNSSLVSHRAYVSG